MPAAVIVLVDKTGAFDLWTSWSAVDSKLWLTSKQTICTAGHLGCIVCPSAALIRGAKPVGGEEKRR